MKQCTTMVARAVVVSVASFFVGKAFDLLVKRFGK